MPTKTDHPDALSRFTGSLVRRAQQRHLAVWQSQVLRRLLLALLPLDE